VRALRDSAARFVVTGCQDGDLRIGTYWHGTVLGALRVVAVRYRRFLCQNEVPTAA